MKDERQGGGCEVENGRGGYECKERWDTGWGDGDAGVQASSKGGCACMRELAKLERRRVGIYCMTPVYRGYTHARCTNYLHARIQQKHTRARRYNIFHPSPSHHHVPSTLLPTPLSLSPSLPRSSSVRASPPLTAPGVDFPATYSPSLLRVFILGDKLVKSLVCVRVV